MRQHTALYSDLPDVEIQISSGSDVTLVEHDRELRVCGRGWSDVDAKVLCRQLSAG